MAEDDTMLLILRR